MQEALAVVILAAGLGKRMGLSVPKVLAETSEGPMLGHVLNTAQELAPQSIVVVTGHKREMTEEYSAKWVAESSGSAPLHFAFQEQQLGTGHAVQQALSPLSGFRGTVLILYGDVPLLEPDTLRGFLAHHASRKATLSVLTALTSQPDGYGRILRAQGEMKAIRESKDCSEEERLVQEVNTGIYLVDSAFLGPAVRGLNPSNAQGEYYLTDIVEKAVVEGQTVATFLCAQFHQCMGVNTLRELAEVNEHLRSKRIQQFQQNGVHFVDPATVWIGPEVTIAAGVTVGPNVQLLGATTIEENVSLEGTAFIKNSQIGAGCELKFGLRIEDAHVGENCSLGPFAHLRPGTNVSADAKIGNFVEIKNSTVERGAKVSHLSYIGDAEIGPSANIGAGTITCNYDGFKKSKTVIGEGAFIGSNSSLVAPVEIGAGATIGAGSIITKPVTPDALALTRSDQREIPGWSKKNRNKSSR